MQVHEEESNDGIVMCVYMYIQLHVYGVCCACNASYVNVFGSVECTYGMF